MSRETGRQVTNFTLTSSLSRPSRPQVTPSKVKPPTFPEEEDSKGQGTTGSLGTCGGRTAPGTDETPESRVVRRVTTRAHGTEPVRRGRRVRTDQDPPPTGACPGGDGLELPCQNKTKNLLRPNWNSSEYPLVLLRNLYNSEQYVVRDAIDEAQNKVLRNSLHNKGKMSIPSTLGVPYGPQCRGSSSRS